VTGSLTLVGHVILPWEAVRVVADILGVSRPGKQASIGNPPAALASLCRMGGFARLVKTRVCQLVNRGMENVSGMCE
jgi:hypothetical protein